MSRNAIKYRVQFVDMDSNRLPMISGNKFIPSNRGPILKRNNTFCGRRHSTHVPQPGREYDYRRLSDTRMSSRKHVHGQTRPHVPDETHGYETIRSHVHVQSNISPHEECILDTNIGGHAYESSPGITSCDFTDRPEISRRCSMSIPLLGKCKELHTSNRVRNKKCGNSTNTDDRTIVAPHASQVHKETDNDLASRRSSLAVKPSHVDVHRYDVILSDSDQDTGFLSPTTDSSLDLTESVIRFFFQREVNKEHRIAKWLADCEEKTCMTSLPAHLPDISVQRRNVEV